MARTNFYYSSVYRPLADQYPGWLIQLTDEIATMAAEKGVKGSSAYETIGCTLLKKTTIIERAEHLGWPPTTLGYLLREQLERLTDHSNNTLNVAINGVRWYGNVKWGHQISLGLELVVPPTDPIVKEIETLCGALSDVTGLRVSPANNDSPHISLMRFENEVPRALQNDIIELSRSAVPCQVDLAQVFYE